MFGYTVLGIDTSSWLAYFQYLGDKFITLPETGNKINLKLQRDAIDY